MEAGREKTTYSSYTNSVKAFLEYEQEQPQHAHIDLDSRCLDFLADSWVKLPFPDSYRESLNTVSY